ncbi:MAG: HAMP domain-containing protein [Desulfamplus sp.]|nr:HAMP domain-containing protein [Desulfamplus sp.]
MDNIDLEKSRRKKELIMIAVILLTVSLLTFAEMKITGLGEAIPVSNAVLMFILINTNLLLLLALILLVFRNLAKLYYEKKSKILGSKFKTKLVAAFITLSLVPTSVLFFFSIHFISTSLAFWFNAPVEQALVNSLSVGRLLYKHLENKNIYFAERAVEHIDTDNFLSPDKKDTLNLYGDVLRRTFDLHALEIYKKDGSRVIVSLSPDIATLDPMTTDALMQVDPLTGTKTFSEHIPTGEIIKTVAIIPSGSTVEKARAFLVASALISSELSSHLASISKGVEEYQQLTMIKKPVQLSNYIALSIVALLVVFCAIWFGFHLAKSITIPIMKFAEGTQRVTQGDLSYTIDFEGDDEIATLVDSFNSMTRELASGRAKLAESKKMVEKQNEEIEKSRQYMEIVLRNISAGVISVDRDGIITTINKAAEKMLNIISENILNRHYRETLKDELLELAEKIYREIPSSLNHVQLPLTFTINGSPRYFLAHFTALRAEGLDNKQQRPHDADVINSGSNTENSNRLNVDANTVEIVGTVMVFDDVTELEKAQRIVAWREVARRIAHEVKNPLTPIKLSAQRLKRKYSKIIQEDVFDQCTETIVEHVDLIRNLVNEFSTFAKFPDTRMVSARIETIIQETIALYKEGLENVDIQFSYPSDLPELQLDRQQMKQAFINLFDNAVAALNKHGTINIDITYDRILKFVRIEMADNGKGISDNEKTRLFEPYFSTKKSGMGLGLAIVNSIITDHKGMIRVQDNKPTGAKFIIELPV